MATHESLNGDSAGRRKAIGELLFFSSVGDLQRIKKLVLSHQLKLNDPSTADYDKRMPLHLAAAEGCHSVAAWLIAQGCDVNAIDRFQRTPLEEAVRGDHGEVAHLLVQKGGKVVGKDGDMLDLAESPLAGNVRIFTDFNPEWEINPEDLQVKEQIGEGEFGVVHRATWFGASVAVKILKDTSSVAIGDFRSELNVLQKVHHPHAVLFLGAVTKNQPFMIVTEYMNGGSLTDMFRSGKYPSLWRAVELALDMARGLAYMHNRIPHAVIHRDLKPANLMIGGHKIFNSYHKTVALQEIGVLKVADFGLSKSLKLGRRQRVRRGSNDSVDGSARGASPHAPNPEGSSSASFAGAAAPRGSGPKASPHVGFGPKGPVEDLKSGKSMRTESYKLTGETGSYRYMAPEVFRHEPYNNKVDVYGFAMICYQLFEGTLPFNQYAPVDAAQAAGVLGKRPHWSSKPRNGQVVPQRLRALVESCWAPAHENRPEFDDVILELEAIAETLPMKI